MAARRIEFAGNAEQHAAVDDPQGPLAVLQQPEHLGRRLRQARQPGLGLDDAGEFDERQRQ